MTVTGVRLADPTQTTTKAGYANYSRKAQEEPTQTPGVNFEGRKDADTFEKKESHTVRNAVVGTAVGVAALAAVAAICGKYGVKFKDPQNSSLDTGTLVSFVEEGGGLISLLKSHQWEGLFLGFLAITNLPSWSLIYAFYFSLCSI